MNNPFFNNAGHGRMPNPNGIDMNQVKRIYNMLKNSNNPNELLESMIRQNPQMANTINLIRNNGNYEQVFRNLCQQRGINPDEFMKQIAG